MQATTGTRQLRSKTAAAAKEAAQLSEGERSLENLWVAFCKLREDHRKQSDELKRVNMAIDAMVETMCDVQDEVKALRQLEQGAKGSEGGSSSRQQALQLIVSDCQEQLAVLADTVAAMQQQQQAAPLDPGSPRTYAAVAGQPPPHAAAPTMHTFRLVPCKHGDAAGGLNQVPTSTSEATKLAIQVLHDLQHDLHAASVRVQWSQPKTATAQSAPVAVVMGLLQTDACMLRSLLWEERTKQKLQRAGWRISIHLPPDELKCKQALWAQFGKQLRAWVDAGKRLVYTKHHQAVTVAGEAIALELRGAASA